MAYLQLQVRSDVSRDTRAVACANCGLVALSIYNEFGNVVPLVLSIEQSKTAILYFPAWWKPYVRLAKAHEGRGRLKEALRVLYRSILIAPEGDNKTQLEAERDRVKALLNSPPDLPPAELVD